MTTKNSKPLICWIEWTGTENAPVMVRMIHDKSELTQRSTHLPKGNWIEEFDLFTNLENRNGGN